MSWLSLVLSQNFTHTVGSMLDFPKIRLESRNLIKDYLLNHMAFPNMHAGFFLFIFFQTSWIWNTFPLKYILGAFLFEILQILMPTLKNHKVSHKRQSLHQKYHVQSLLTPVPGDALKRYDWLLLLRVKLIWG